VNVEAQKEPKTGSEKQLDWRAEAELTDFDPDDELLPETPKEVVAALGFDPLEESEGKKE